MIDDLDPQEFEDTARAVIESCAQADTAAERGKLLAEAGLIGVLAPEEAGGLGLPLAFAVPVAAAAGEGLLAYPLLEAMALSKALASTDTDIAGRIAAGDMVATIAWLGTDEDGLVAGAPMGLDANHALIFRTDGTAVFVALGDTAKAEETHSLDIDMPESTIRISGSLGNITLDAQTVQTLNEDVDLLRAAFIRGSAERCLDMACNHAQERTQFGKPLSANQAIRHRLSRDLLAVETMRNGIARALSSTGAESEMARSAVSLDAAHVGPGIAESAIQVFGGMGFTWEVSVHRHLRQIHAQARYGRAAQALESFADRTLRGGTNTWYEEIPDAV